MSLLFEKRVFCRYVCPIGGFIGLYSMTAPVELRVRDRQVCVDHRTKDCITGNERGYGCPWMVYPGKLDRNLDCGLCTECLKTCTMDNVVVNLRRPGADLGRPVRSKKVDEAFKALIMLACSIIYPAVLFGPWSTIKEWAAFESFVGWALYAAGFLAATLLVGACGGPQDDSGGMMMDDEPGMPESGMMEDAAQMDDRMAPETMSDDASSMNDDMGDDSSMMRDTSEMRRP